MRQISLRKFKNEVPDLDEVVEVSRRDPFGNIQVLGFWTPYMQAVPGSVPLPLNIVEDRTPEQLVLDGDAAPVRASRSFSKAEQAGRKKR